MLAAIGYWNRGCLASSSPDFNETRCMHFVICVELSDDPSCSVACLPGLNPSVTLTDTSNPLSSNTTVGE